MYLEVDLLPASTKSKGGDSALIRVGNFNYQDDCQFNNQFVILLDSGYAENAKRIATHLRETYKTNKIDLAIITHPDMDHISGLYELLQSDQDIIISKTLIHDPWVHTKNIFNKTEDGRRTVQSIENSFEQTLSKLSDILETVGEKNTEPFLFYEKKHKFKFYVLGPSKKKYQELLYKFPGMEGESSSARPLEIYEDRESNYSVDTATTHFLENPETSAKNDSSVIFLIQSDEGVPLFLFTGDAGVDGLNHALDYADSKGITYKGVDVFQIPHHGSIKNIDEDTINRISPQQAYVSAPPEKKEHPSKLVLNYFTKNNIKTYHLQDENSLVYSFPRGRRPGLIEVQPVPIFYKLYKLLTKKINFFSQS